METERSKEQGTREEETREIASTEKKRILSTKENTEEVRDAYEEARRKNLLLRKKNIKLEYELFLAHEELRRARNEHIDAKRHCVNLKTKNALLKRRLETADNRADRWIKSLGSSEKTELLKKKLEVHIYLNEFLLDLFKGEKDTEKTSAILRTILCTLIDREDKELQTLLAKIKQTFLEKKGVTYVFQNDTTVSK